MEGEGAGSACSEARVFICFESQVTAYSTLTAYSTCTGMGCLRNRVQFNSVEDTAPKSCRKCAGRSGPAPTRKLAGRLIVLTTVLRRIAASLSSALRSVDFIYYSQLMAVRYGLQRYGHGTARTTFNCPPSSVALQ